MNVVDYPGLCHSIKLIFISLSVRISEKKRNPEKTPELFLYSEEYKNPSVGVLPFFPKPYIALPSEKLDSWCAKCSFLLNLPTVAHTVETT